MSSLDEKKAAAKAVHLRHTKDADVLCQKFADLFSSETGTEILAHLWKRFEVEGRTFLATEGGEVSALRAAVRDGERAAISYIFAMAKKANPEIKHP
jgi:hypothetical protein